ncbi:endoribonuclease ZC3H12A [Hemicordylus capensis]|uniref:endoribonuclease ZC3H12A n=1 Tax=Hemicordylus capensis TaxID=884348 RepID=UPI0023026E72|nr:endoribonuclease ZC3H12A [Hemicordylus capensis]
MDLDSIPTAALGFPGWREPLPFARRPSIQEEPGQSSAFESGYLSLKAPSPEECRASGGTMADLEAPWSSSEQDHTEMQMKVDFFRKLGYSSGEILVVLQKHGLNADTNTVLGELVKHGMAVVERDPADPPQEAPETPLVPRGGMANKGPAPTVAAEGKEGENLRPIVIDGSNVAMSHGDKDVFSCRGILLAVNWFLDRGHTDITVFVPSWRKEQPRPDVPIADQHILHQLEKKKILVFTPSRRVGGKRVVCYDDRFIVKLAYESDGIVVSNDVYRDLQTERPEWKKFIEERLLMYSFANDKFMPPEDPLGRHGPSLDNFLRKKPVVLEHKKQQCPYGKKCTYGIKCKFYHPERLNQTQRSVADELRANARLSPTRSAAKEERLSRRPCPAEFLGPPGAGEGDKASLPMAAEKKGSSGPKAKPGDLPPLLTPGPPASSSGSYRPPDWYQPPPMSPHMDSLPYDSGIGSLESQFSEMWPGPGASHSAHSHPEHLAMGHPRRGQRPPYQPPPGPEPNSYAHYQPRGYRKPASATGSGASYLPYGPEASPSRAAHSFPGYSLPADASTPLGHGRRYWSEPYQPAPAGHQELPRAPQVAYGDSCQWATTPDRFAEERAKVHVKLCGIFHPHLVDAVMSRFPQLLDPQQLAAEILTYKNQNPRV